MTTKQTGHTQLPWIFLPQGQICHPDSKIIKNEDEFDWVCSLQVSNVPEWKANGKFIVKAVNNHYNLLEACKEALAHLDKYTSGIALDCKDSLRMAIKKAEATK